MASCSLPLATFGAATKFNNFGDRLSTTILQEVLGVEATEIDVSDGCRSPSFLCIGSILHLALPGDVVWGAGLRLASVTNSMKDIEFHAVRGPLTARLVEQLGGPTVSRFGDPGLLISRVSKYRSLAESHGKSRSESSNVADSEVTVIPHYVHWSLLSKKLSTGLRLRSKANPILRRLGRLMATEYKAGRRFNYFSVFEPEEDFVRAVVKSNVVVSSSLHALITSVAFGIPICWWWPKYFHEKGDMGQRFKYYDFFASVGIDAPQPVRQIETPESNILRISPPIELADDLLKSFPKSILVD